MRVRDADNDAEATECIIHAVSALNCIYCRLTVSERIVIVTARRRLSDVARLQVAISRHPTPALAAMRWSSGTQEFTALPGRLR